MLFIYGFISFFSMERYDREILYLILYFNTYWIVFYGNYHYNEDVS